MQRLWAKQEVRSKEGDGMMMRIRIRIRIRIVLGW
jgi:hypothetical protein